MKKLTKLLIILLTVSALVALSALTVSALTREETNYLIETPEDLVAFANAVANDRKANAKLMADLDMTGVTYTPPTVGYYGTFDGQGHTIKGLSLSLENAPSGNYGLLFNTLGNGYGEFVFGEVMNLTIKDSSISVTSDGLVNVGALTGKCDRNDVYDVTFENVSVSMTGAENSAAGLVTGYSCWASTRGGNPTIEYFNIKADDKCSVTANGTGVWAGSVVGMHDWDPIYFHGIDTAAKVSAPNGGAGGVIGYQKSGNNPKFYGVKVSSDVTGTTVGALVGKAAAPDYGLIAIENNTDLPLLGSKTQAGNLGYYDDVATYGALPKTDDGKYCISTYDELRWFVKFYNGDNNKWKIRNEATALLVNDLDMTGKAWTPIEYFRGTIDGGGHTISGITVNVENAPNDTKHGLLIGTLGSHYDGKIFGRVENIVIADSTLTVSGNGIKYNVGGIAGESNRGSFYNCSLKNVDITVTGNLNSGTVLGGIAGWVAFAPENPGRDYIQSYINCHLDADCSITTDCANVDLGGIFGILGSECVRVMNSTVSATLSGKGNVGGLAGNISSGGNRWYMISDCGFYGKITEGNVSGGIIGYAKKNGYIIDTTVTGSIEGTTKDTFIGKLESGFDVYQYRNSNGNLAITDGSTLSLYCQTRRADIGHDLRILLLADMTKLSGYQSVDVTVEFYKSNGTLVKTYQGKLGVNGTYALYQSILADNETFTAAENNAIFGSVITDIPNGAYDYYDITAKSENGTVLASGTTKPAPESSLEGKTFYFLGSSVTYGSASGGKSMADFIAERNNCTVVKEAVSGTTLVDNDGGSYVSRMKNSSYFKKNAKVDHFIVQLSTNDAGQNRTLGTVSDSYNLEDFDTMTIIGAMEYIICYVKTTWDCPVTFYTGTMYNSNLYVQMVQALYELKDKWGIGVIDMFFDVGMCSVPTADYNRYISDPVHPNILGYEGWWTPVFEKHLRSYQYD